jgi:2-succinyl-5-enolpyruvyl-6-hydroxy-3-cyclohexene-1-carboxylate synthase
MKLREAFGYKRPSIVIVLMNNGGGAIFDMLPQKHNNPYFERLFLTPQNINFKAAAETFSVPYWCVDCIDGFKKALGETLGDPGIHLIEIKLPLQGVKERYAPFQ